MSDTFLVQCPESDSGDFDRLLDDLLKSKAIDLSVKPDVVRVHPFDGQVLLEMVLPVTAGVLAVVRTWIRARYEQKKSYFFMKDGDIIAVAGYDPDKAIEMIRNYSQSDDE